MAEITGQMTMFDTQTGRPCDYRFTRYIGQLVRRWRTGETARITEIKPYYTYLDDGTVGTPYDICEVKEGQNDHGTDGTGGEDPEGKA